MLRYAITIFLFQSALGVCIPKLTLYKEDFTNLTITSNEPNLAPGYVASSTDGTWVKYDTVNYTTESLLAVSSSWPCSGSGGAVEEERNDYNIRSARMAGSPLDAYLPAVTLYPLELLEGAETVLLEGSELPTLQSTLGSLIIMNSALVEFFPEENYAGDSFCLVTEPGLHTVFFDFENADLPYHIPDSRSVRFGCSPKAVKMFSKGQGSKYFKNKN